MKKKKILIVDDEPSFCEYMKELLSGKGYDVVVAEGGIQGFVKAKACKPDLIILDINMPKVSGCTLSSVLAPDPEMQHIPIIFLTGYISPEEAARAKNQLAGHVLLSKPFEANELLQKIEQELAKQT